MPLPPSTAADRRRREKNENVIAWKYSGIYFYNNNKKEHAVHLFLFVNFPFVPKRTGCLPAHHISFLRSFALMRFHNKLLQLQAMQRTSIDFHLKWRRWKYVTIMFAANWFDEHSSPPLHFLFSFFFLKSKMNSTDEERAREKKRATKLLLAISVKVCVYVTFETVPGTSLRCNWLGDDIHPILG